MDLIIFGIILSSWGLRQLIETSLIFVASYGKGKFSSRKFQTKILILMYLEILKTNNRKTLKKSLYSYAKIQQFFKLILRDL